jgi:hypothetical protein
MTRVALLVAVILGAAGCTTKPSAEECRTAIENMRRLMGTENLREDTRIEGDIRRCKGGSKKKAVQCAIKAQTLDDLRHCDFYKVPENTPGVGPTGGSAAPAPTGSATGSAAPGAAAPGSAAPAAAGSAEAGSAATGSAAAGSAAAGSAAGSAGSAK